MMFTTPPRKWWSYRNGYVRKSPWTSWNLTTEIIDISTNHHFSLIPSYIPKNSYDVNYVNHQISLKSSRNQKNRQVEDLMSLDFDVLTQTEDFLEELVPRPCRISVVLSGGISMGENMWTDMKKPWFPSEKHEDMDTNGAFSWVFHICVSLEEGHLRLFMVTFGEELSKINMGTPENNFMILDLQEHRRNMEEPTNYPLANVYNYGKIHHFIAGKIHYFYGHFQ